MQGFLNFSKTGGNPDGSDVWAPTLGCHANDGWFEKNLTFIGCVRNITICEPCNFNSNLAFYRTSARICDRDKQRKWGFSDDYKKAIVRSAASQATGRAFMHGSETRVGMLFDTKGEAILPLLTHQLAIAALPEPW